MGASAVGHGESLGRRRMRSRRGATGVRSLGDGEAREREAAKERLSEAGRLGGQGSGKLPEASKGRTRDHVARYAGKSGRTLEKAVKVVEAAEAWGAAGAETPGDGRAPGQPRRIPREAGRLTRGWAGLGGVLPRDKGDRGDTQDRGASAGGGSPRTPALCALCGPWGDARAAGKVQRPS